MLMAARTQRRGQAEAAAAAEQLAASVHWSEKPLSSMTERDWRICREDFDIRVLGGRAPHPMRTWAEGRLPPPIMKAIAELGWAKPSAIQISSSVRSITPWRKDRSA